MRKRKLVGFPCTSACKMCLNYEATEVMNTCKNGHITLCYGCDDEDGNTDVCPLCEAKEETDNVRAP